MTPGEWVDHDRRDYFIQKKKKNEKEKKKKKRKKCGPSNGGERHRSGFPKPVGLLSYPCTAASMKYWTGRDWAPIVDADVPRMS